MSDRVKNKAIRDMIKNLRLKLAEKEEMIRAIQSGAVDVPIKKTSPNEVSIFPLQGAELTYQILIESMNEGAITIIKDGTIAYSNKRFAEFVKLPPEKIINTNIFDYVQQVNNKRISLKDICKKNIKEVFILKARDKTSKTVIFSCKPLQLNKVKAISIVVTDLSEIQEAEKRYSTLVENASCGILVHNSRGVIIEANKQAENILDRSKKELIGSNIRKFAPESEHANVAMQLKRLASKNFIGPNEGHYLRPNGEIRDIVYTATHTYFGKKKLILAVFNDTTERNRLLSQALLKDKLASVGTIATGIVHEINNPLTWLTSNLVYLKENLNKLNRRHIIPAKQKTKFDAAIDESIQGSNKITAIIQTLKEFARIDDEKLEPVDINKVLDSAITMTDFQFKNCVKIEKSYARNIPSLLSNKNKLHQVFLNLIINAAQSMDENKKNNTIVVKSYLKNRYACIDVTDTGKGITPDNLSKIFEPFFTTKPEGIGTGLGLSLCYDIIKSLGGVIEVKSKSGIGSTFTINLPTQFETQQKIDTKKTKRGTKACLKKES